MRIFVSYAHADAQSFADEVRASLEHQSHEVWLDREGGIRPGGLWDVSIEEGLRNADAVVAILTPAAVRDDGFCRNEITYALAMKKPIIPIKYIECATPIQIYRVQHIDYMRDGSSLDELTNRLREGGRAPNLSPDKAHILDFSADLARLGRDVVPRPWLADLVLRTTQSPDEHGILITAAPGWGKSAFLGLLAKSYEQVGAVHLFKSTDQRTLEPRRLVRSLAAQLSERIGQYAPPLGDTQQQLERRSPVELAQDLIIEPLLLLADGGKLPETWVLLDALDEVATAASSSDLLEVLSVLVDQLPAALVVVSASRPHDRIERMLSGLRTVALGEHPRQIGEDIERYAASKLRRDDFGSAIAKHAQGNYWVAEAAAKALARDGAALQDVDKVPPKMELVYLEAFEERFPSTDEYRETTGPVLGLIATAMQPLRVETLARFLNRDPTEVSDALRSLRSLIPQRDGLVTFDHRTLREWLIDLALADQYAVSVPIAEARLADACREWKQLLNVDERYGLRWGPVHALRAGRTDALRSFILDPAYVSAFREAFGVEDWTLLLAELANAAEPDFFDELARSIDEAQDPQVATDLGLMAYRRDRFDEAQRLFEAAIRLATLSANWDLLAEAYARRGWVESAQGRRAAAEDFYRLCRDVAKEHGSDHGMLIAYRHFARMFERQSRPVEAEAAYRGAIELAEKLDRPFLLISAYCGLGELYTEERQPERALKELRMAIDLAERYDSSYHMMVSKTLWARAAMRSPGISSEQIERSLETALTIGERRGSSRGIGEAKLTLGELAASEQQFGEAQIWLEDATTTLWRAGVGFVMAPLKALVELPNLDGRFEFLVREVLDATATGEESPIAEIIRTADRERELIRSGLTLIAERPVPMAGDLLRRGTAALRDCPGIEVGWRKEENLHFTIIPVKRRNGLFLEWPPPLAAIRTLASVSPKIRLKAREAFVTPFGGVVLVVMPEDESLALLRTGLNLVLPEIDDAALPYFPHITLGFVSAVTSMESLAQFRKSIPRAFEDLDLQFTISHVSLVNYQTRNLDIVRGSVTWPLDDDSTGGYGDTRDDDEITLALGLQGGPDSSLLDDI